MIILIDAFVYIMLLTGCCCIVSWFWEVGIQEIVIYTEHFLLEETKKIRVQVLPGVNSTKAWDKLELSLYYSGIRNYFPFVSGKVWLMFCTACICITFVIVMITERGFIVSVLLCAAEIFILVQILDGMRRQNMRATEKYLLELINVTESFAVTGEEPTAILASCSHYLKGPIGYVLKSIDRHTKQGWSSQMILEQLKIKLEHPKWQEFIHNLSICSMYNSEYSFVFRSSRKSIQLFLSSKKDRQAVKHTAQIEMAIISLLSAAIIFIMGDFLEISITELMWGNVISKACTIYIVGIVALFYWKIGLYEKE